MTSVRNTARSEASEEVTEGESNVRVDDNRYLPRLMHSFYGEDYPVEHGDVWAPFEKRLSDARLALLSSAGLHLRSQQPFDLERERREPTWGDSSYRMLPNTVQRDDLAVAHLHHRFIHGGQAAGERSGQALGRPRTRGPAVSAAVTSLFGGGGVL